MKKPIISIPLIGVVLLSSCFDERQDIANTVILNEKILDDAEELYVVEDFQNLLEPAKNYYVYNDSIFILHCYEYEGCSLLRFFDNSYNSIKDICRYGNGYGEWLDLDITINGEHLFINDMLKSQLLDINLDNNIIDNENDKSIIKYNVKWLTAVVPYGIESVIAANPYYLHDSNNKIYQGKQRLIVANRDYVYPNFTYDVWNVTQRQKLLKNINKEEYIYVNPIQSCIEIYDSCLINIKTIKGPRALKSEFSIRQNAETNQKIVSYGPLVIGSYVGGCLHQDNLYLLYVGERWSDDIERNQNPTYVLKFDSNYELTKAYKYSGALYSISKGKDEDVFYATAYDGVDDCKLIKLSTK